MDQTVQKKSQSIRPFPGFIQKTSTTCSSWVLIYSNGVYLHNNLDVKVLWWQCCFSLQPLEAGLWVASKLRPLPCNHYGTKSSLSKPFLIVICHQRAKPKSMIGSRVIFAMSLTLSVSRKNNTFPLKKYYQTRNNNGTNQLIFMIWGFLLQIWVNWLSTCNMAKQKILLDIDS